MKPLRRTHFFLLSLLLVFLLLFLFFFFFIVVRFLVLLRLLLVAVGIGFLLRLGSRSWGGRCVAVTVAAAAVEDSDLKMKRGEFYTC